MHGTSNGISCFQFVGFLITIVMVVCFIVSLIICLSAPEPEDKKDTTNVLPIESGASDTLLDYETAVESETELVFDIIVDTTDESPKTYGDN